MRNAATALLLLALSARHAAATPLSARDGLSTLKYREKRHGFTAQAAFVGVAGERIGARFVHRTGLVIDVLFFDSIPQFSTAIASMPVSDRGEPHALEHLLVRSGVTGLSLQTLLSMRLGVQTAVTYRDLTCYSFRTAGGRDAFYEILAQYLTALVQPDFSDLEVRREVADIVAVPSAAGDALMLAQRGAVSGEMLTTMARASRRQTDALKELLVGKDHPLARNSGGDPQRLLELTPTALREYHRATYRVGPGMHMIACLPLEWSVDEFLERFESLLAKVVTADAPAVLPPVPPFHPAGSGEIRIDAYPSTSADTPQDVLLGWQALGSMAPDDKDALEVLLSILAGGDASLLHRDLVDQATRSFDSGSTGVHSEIDETIGYPYVTVKGIPASLLERDHLRRIQDQITRRVRWLATLPDGAPELHGIARKTQAQVHAARRGYFKFIDTAPGFGQFGSVLRRWHDRLNRVADGQGFARSIAPLAVYSRIERDTAAGRNPWRSLIQRARLSEPPYVVALRPDPSLAAREKAQGEARFKQYEADLAARLGGGDAQKALAAHRYEYDAASALLAAVERAVPKPAFMPNPPLTLDDAAFERGSLPSGVPFVSVHFDTMAFTDVAVAFDMNGVSAEEWMLLPLLDIALSGVGVTTRSGESLNYIEARERREAETASFSIQPIGHRSTRRHELEIAASAASVEEIPRAVEWMENHILRPSLRSARVRLLDICRQAIQTQRGVLDTSEYSWASQLATAFEYQDDALQIGSSVFTKLRLLTRIRWRLEDPTPESRSHIESDLAALERLLATGADRTAIATHLGSVKGELGETLRYELAALPDDRWREDLSELIESLRADLDVGSARVIAGLERLQQRLFVRSRARVRTTASRRNAKRALRLLDALVIRLPTSNPSPPDAMPSPSMVHSRLEQRYGPLPRPVHVGFVRPSATSGVHVVLARGTSYASRDRSELLDLLAVGVFAGSGPHSFANKTAAAGLAYSNGIGAWVHEARTVYYADRCQDLTQTMLFVRDLASAQDLEDPFLLEYSLAGVFGDFRGGNDLSSRGAMLADNLADGITPGLVSDFKRLLLATARESGVLRQIRDSAPDAIGKVVVGYGTKRSRLPRTLAFAIGSEQLLAEYESFLRKQGEAERLVRIYPRDFWPLAKEEPLPRSSAIPYAQSR